MQQPTEETAISFKRGEVVLRSQPFTYVLEAQFRTSVCDYCLQQCQDNETMKGKRCSACKIVYYCNTSCQKKAWFNHHREECICLRKVSNNILPTKMRVYQKNRKMPPVLRHSSSNYQMRQKLKSK